MFLVALAFLLVLPGCVVRPAVRQPASVRPFVLTFWCAPPLAELDDARMAEIANAGFTTVGAPCEGGLDEASNRRILALAEQHGLRVWVADHRLYAAAAGAPDAAALTAAVVASYRDAPALDGYVVADEPTHRGVRPPGTRRRRPAGERPRPPRLHQPVARLRSPEAARAPRATTTTSNASSTSSSRAW